MPRSRASDEAFSCLVIVNMISLVFAPSITMQLQSIMAHIVLTVLSNALSSLAWLMLYEGIRYCNVSVPVNMYWNQLASSFRVAVLLVLLYCYCFYFTSRVILVGLTSSYFMDKHRMLTSRSTLSSTAVLSSGSASIDTTPFLRHDPIERQPLHTAPRTTPFGDRIPPPQPRSDPSFAHGRRVRSDSDNVGEKEKKRRPERSEGGHLTSPMAQEREAWRGKDYSYSQDQNQLSSGFTNMQQGGGLSAQALAEGTPHGGEGIQLSEENTSIRKKRKALSDGSSVGTEGANEPQAKKIFHETAAPLSLWQQVYHGISALVAGTDNPSSVKRKRSDESDVLSVQPPKHSKRPDYAISSTLLVSPTRAVAAKRPRNQGESEPKLRTASESGLGECAQERHRKAKHCHFSDSENREGEEEERLQQLPHPSSPPPKTNPMVTTPQSKYLQGLLKKKEEATLASAGGALVLVAATGEKKENSARPSLRRALPSVRWLSVMTDQTKHVVVLCNTVLFIIYLLYSLHQAVWVYCCWSLPSISYLHLWL